MDTLYHQTNRLVQEIQAYFTELNNPQADVLSLENNIQTKLTSLNANCDRLDILIYKVPVSQRPSARMRVEQLKYDARHLQNSLQMWRHKKKRNEIENNEREQLLNHRYTTNIETAINIDQSIEYHNSLSRANQGVDEMLSTGSSVLDNLRNQREIFKGAGKRILNISNTLGISNHTIKLIERRLSEDKYVLFGGMLFTLVVVVLIIYFIVF